MPKLHQSIHLASTTLACRDVLRLRTLKVADVAVRLFIFLFCLSLLPQTVPMKLFTLFFVCVFSFVAAEEDERLPNKCEGRTKKRR